MLYRVLAVGDIVGEPGLKHLERHLRSLQKLKKIDFTVVNGENASGVGLTPDQAWRIYDAGADAVTLGNHTYGKQQIGDFLEDTPWILRPANYTGRAPGHGVQVFDMNGVRVRVVNLIGRCDLDWKANDPFTTMDRLLDREKADFTLVISMRRQPVRSWRWAIIWMDVYRRSGERIPMCPRRMSGSIPREPATSRILA